MIILDPRSPTPPFEQLRAQLVAQITNGELASGVRLPTVRRLAADLGIAPNTVARTYRELESEGVIETRGRHGSFVTTATTGPDAAHTQARRAARDFAERIRTLGLSDDDAVALVRDALR